jgi:hypothetical protein
VTANRGSSREGEITVRDSMEVLRPRSQSYPRDPLSGVSPLSLRSRSSSSYVPNLSWLVCACGKFEEKRVWGGGGGRPLEVGGRLLRS